VCLLGDKVGVDGRAGGCPGGVGRDLATDDVPADLHVDRPEPERGRRNAKKEHPAGIRL
jgi:hypothetical protein